MTGRPRALVACEYSQEVASRLREWGLDAWSCDISEPAEKDASYHILGDALAVLKAQRWDALIAHPPCTYLCSSGLHWNKRRPERAQKTEEALAFVRELMTADVERIVVENPDGCIGTCLQPEQWGFARQRVQPYMFGDDASKWTALWMKGMGPMDIPEKGLWHPGRKVEWPKGSRKIVTRWSNQTDSGQNALPPKLDRWKDRSRTYPGIADALARHIVAQLIR